jgi:hypothetical protein
MQACGIYYVIPYFKFNPDEGGFYLFRGNRFRFSTFAFKGVVSPNTRSPKGRIFIKKSQPVKA